MGHAGVGFQLESSDHPVLIQFETPLVDATEFAFARAPALADPGSFIGLIRSDFTAISLGLSMTLGLF